MRAALHGPAAAAVRALRRCRAAIGSVQQAPAVTRGFASGLHCAPAPGRARLALTSGSCGAQARGLATGPAEAGSAVVVVPFDKRSSVAGGTATASREAAELRAEEIASLVKAAGWRVAACVLAPRDDPGAERGADGKRRKAAGRRSARGGLPVGRGKLSEVANAVLATGARVVVVDGELGPAQARAVRRHIKSDARLLLRQAGPDGALPALEDRDGDVVATVHGWDAGGAGAAEATVDALSVTDRHGVILDIFARRARTREARLQVELAALERQKAYLRGGGGAEMPSGGGGGDGSQGGHSLEQQRAAGGGFGFIGGSGERRIELDRRRLAARADAVRASLAEIERTRRVTRGQTPGSAADASDPASAASQPVVVALAGYTNAGKSHLARALTGDDAAFAPKDELFATLGSTRRRLLLPSGVECRIVDTVGFVEGLPHSLVASFRATLADVAEADVILHVRDPTHPRCAQQAQAVRSTIARVLKPWGATAADPFGGKPVIEVWTKVDRLPAGTDVEALMAAAEAPEPRRRDRPASAAAAAARGPDAAAAETALDEATGWADDGAGAGWVDDGAGAGWADDGAGAGWVDAGEEAGVGALTSGPESDDDDDGLGAAAGRPEAQAVAPVLTSAVRGDGLGELMKAVDGVVRQQRGLRTLSVALDPSSRPEDALVQDWLFQRRPGVRVVDTAAVVPTDASPASALVVRALMTPDAVARFRADHPGHAALASVD